MKFILGLILLIFITSLFELPIGFQQNSVHNAFLPDFSLDLSYRDSYNHILPALRHADLSLFQVTV